MWHNMDLLNKLYNFYTAPSQYCFIVGMALVVKA